MLNRRRLLMGSVVLVLAGTAFVWWWSRAPQKEPTPQPPDVILADPYVAQAVATARAEVLAQPRSAAAWGRLGQTFQANGYTEPARGCFVQAARLDPRDLRWPYLEGIGLLLNNPMAALPCWQRAAECPGQDQHAATARLRWAEALLANDRLDEAESVLHGVVEEHPTNPRAHYNLGLLAVARNTPEIAVEHFRKCADQPTARRKANLQLASLFTAQSKTAQATESARRAEEVPPDLEWPDPILAESLPFTVGRDSLFLQAEKHEQQGNAPEAIRLFQQVIRQYPDEGRAYTKLGLVFAESGNYPDAERVLRAGLLRSPDMVQGHFFLAVALFHQAERAGLTSTSGREKLNAALTAAQRAIELKPDHGFAHVYRGLILKHLGQPKEALAALREAVRCTPEASAPHMYLGENLTAPSQAEEALKELELAVRLASPNDPRPKAALERFRKTAP